MMSPNKQRAYEAMLVALQEAALELRSLKGVGIRISDNVLDKVEKAIERGCDHALNA